MSSGVSLITSAKSSRTARYLSCIFFGMPDRLIAALISLCTVGDTIGLAAFSAWSLSVTASAVMAEIAASSAGATSMSKLSAGSAMPMRSFRLRSSASAVPFGT